MNKSVFIRVVSVVLLIVAIIAFLDFVILRRYRNHINGPHQQHNTEWISGNSNIEFYVGGEYNGYVDGVLISNENQIDVIIVFAGSQNKIYIYEKSSAYDEYFNQTGQTFTRYRVMLVEGSYNMIGKNKCIMKIIETHSDLKVDLGKKIVFRKRIMN